MGTDPPGFDEFLFLLAGTFVLIVLLVCGGFVAWEGIVVTHDWWGYVAACATTVIGIGATIWLGRRWFAWWRNYGHHYTWP